MISKLISYHETNKGSEYFLQHYNNLPGSCVNSTDQELSRAKSQVWGCSGLYQMQGLCVKVV